VYLNPSQVAVIIISLFRNEENPRMKSVLYGFALKVPSPADDYDKFSLMPQRGYGLQPRVAASATLGKESDLVLNRNAVVAACAFLPDNTTQPHCG
jgi:hypothetical protein